MEITPTTAKDNLPKEQIESVQKQQKEYKLLGKQKRVPGHTLFSFNVKTGEIKKAKVSERVSFDIRKVTTISGRIQIESDCYYEQALNVKSFIKRLKRNGLIK